MLDDAVLRDDFRTEPKDTKVAVGDKTLLQCNPPKGIPDPIVHWKKNGDFINLELFDRFRIIDGGSLQISSTQVGDSGKYQCVAQNLVGTRFSDIITLKVHKKPYVVNEPRDAVSMAGEGVEFTCDVDGDPEPQVTWRRSDAKMPVGRAHILDDHTLRIEQTRLADQGVYVCDAENDVGSITTSAVLTVHAPPEFVRAPENMEVALHAEATLDCQVTGNPTPVVFWSREGSQVLMFPGRRYGHVSVSEEGTLRLEVRREDAGYYMCSAVSVAGSNSATALLLVLLEEDVPPPLMEVGPVNQTVPANTSTSLPCQARGLPPPDIKWYKDGSLLIPDSDSHRINVWQNGTLHIDGLQPGDSGLYTCTATSASGESGWSASLAVDPLLPTANVSVSLRTPPPPPARPRLVNATQTSLAVAWSSTPGAAGYSVDYYSPDLQTGWVNVVRGLNTTTIEVSDLKPDTSYVFVVRAESEEGVSLPSEISAVAHTLRTASELQETRRLELARARLTARPQVTLTHGQAVSSTAVTLSWQVDDSGELVEGLHIRYRDLTSGVEVFRLTTLLNTEATSHTLTKLHKYARYQLFLVPFYKTVDGQPSNSLEVHTLEDVPSAPPQHLEVAWVNSSSAFVHWSPPPPQHCNGQLLGYELMLQDGDSLLVRTLRLNSSAMSVLVNNLTTGHVYTASLKAFTRLGSGPAARVKSLRGPSTFTSLPPQQIWLVLTAAVTAVVVVSASAVTLYLRRRHSLTKQIGHLSAVNASDLPHLGLMGGVKEALWIEVPHENLGPRKHITLEGSDYAEVDTQNLSSFYNSRAQTATPTPYATTVLVPNTRHHADSCSETGPLIVPVSNSSSGTKTSNSGDSWLRQEQNKSTLEARDEELRCQQCLGVKDCALPNWNEFLPPPPQHPPPPRPQGLCGSPPMSKKSLGSCSHHSRDSNLVSGVYNQCWQNSSQVPSFPSGYHTGSSIASSCKCRQSVPPCRGPGSQENTMCSRHHEHIHRHEHSHCPCCCQTERNGHRQIRTVSGERVWEDGSYSSTSCSCSEDTTSLQCTFCQNNTKDCPIH